MQRCRSSIAGLGLLAALFLLAGASAPWARAEGRAPILRVVTNLEDSGTGSLRQTIAESGSDDGIEFAAGLAGTIPVLTGEILIDHNLEIVAPGAAGMVLDGGFRSRLMHVLPGATVSIRGLSFYRGRVAGGRGADGGSSANGQTGEDGDGGAIRNEGALRLSECVFRNNFAQGGDGGNSTADDTSVNNPSRGGGGGRGRGGAVSSSGSLVLEKCTFSENTAIGGRGGTNTNAQGGYGGGAGGAAVEGSLTAVNCTFTLNLCQGGDGSTGGPNGGGPGGIAYGGAVYMVGQGVSATLANCTVVGNRLLGGLGGDSVGPSNGGLAKGGPGGLARGGGLALFTARGMITGTLVALNAIQGGSPGSGPEGSEVSAGERGPDMSCQAPLSQGYNLIGITDDSLGWHYPDRTGDSFSPLDPGIVVDGNGRPVLRDNGGPSDTVALRAGSLAIDGGNNAVLGAPFSLSTDQRGLPRRIGASVDIGAFEFDPPGSGLVVTTVHDHDDGVPGTADCTLREAVNAANASASPKTITFRTGLAGTIALQLGELVLARDMTINGPGARAVSISGRGVTRVLRVSAGVASMSGLTIRNGTIFGPLGATVQGGGIHNSGRLTLTSCAVSGNSAVGRSNAAGAGMGLGGGIYNQGTLSLVGCTLSGNDAQGANGYAYPDGTGGSGADGKGGAVYNTGSLTALNCTLSGNRALGGNGASGIPEGTGGAARGGGIFSSGTLVLTNVTVAGNTAIAGFSLGTGSGGGLSIAGGSFRNTLVAGNGAVDAAPDVSGPVTSRGHNLVGKADGSTGWNSSDRTGTIAGPLDPRLNALANNGGSTDTRALLAGSPAIDLGDDAGAPLLDQRGFVRSGASDTGAFEFGGQAPSPPVDASVTPGTGASGALSPRLFSASYSDRNGAGDITSAYFLINNSTSQAGALYGWYDAVNNRLYLRNNANTAWLGGFAPGAPNRVSDPAGVGALNCGQTTVSRSGNLLTVNWVFTPNPSFAGARGLYLFSRDRTGRTDGWDRLGSWNVTMGPSNVSVSPASGSTAAGTARTLTAAYMDPSGNGDIVEARLLVNTSVSGAGALYASYDGVNNKLYLRNNANSAWLGGFPPGSANVIRDPAGQGSLNCAACRVTRTGNTLTLTWSFTPGGTFTGAKNVYLFAKDAAGLSDGLEPLGTWTIQ